MGVPQIRPRLSPQGAEIEATCQPTYISPGPSCRGNKQQTRQCSSIYKPNTRILYGLIYYYGYLIKWPTTTLPNRTHRHQLIDPLLFLLSSLRVLLVFARTIVGALQRVYLYVHTIRMVDDIMALVILMLVQYVYQLTGINIWAKQ